MHWVDFKTRKVERKKTQVVVVFITHCVCTHEILYLTCRNRAKTANRGGLRGS